MQGFIQKSFNIIRANQQGTFLKETSTLLCRQLSSAELPAKLVLGTLTPPAPLPGLASWSRDHQTPWEVLCITPTKRTQLASTALVALNEVIGSFLGFGFCFGNKVGTRTNMSKLPVWMHHPEIPLVIPLLFYSLWVKLILSRELHKVCVSLNCLLLCLELSLCTE